MDSLQKIYCRAFQGAFAVRFMTRWWRTLPLLILKKPGHCIWKAGTKAIIAFGGGSAMDCAKVTGACIVKPNEPIHKMKGLLRICKKLPLLIAVLTTAGTGSETTLTASSQTAAQSINIPSTIFLCSQICGMVTT